MFKKLLTFGRTTCPTCQRVAKSLGAVDSYKGHYYYCQAADCPEKFHEFKYNNGTIHYLNSYVYKKVGRHKYVIKHTDGTFEHKVYN